MNTEQRDQPDTKRNAQWGALALAGRSYLIAAMFLTLLMLLDESSVVFDAFVRLGWRLGPWSSFPFPYDSTYDPSPPFLDEIPTFLAGFVLIMLALTIVVFVIHGLAFIIAVAIHILFGWPRYWRDVRHGIDLWPVWALSARRSWWALPLGALVGFLLDQISRGFQYASYPIVDNGQPYGVMHTLGIGLIFTAVASRLLRVSIAEAVAPDDMRCSHCGYLLRGIGTWRCPECGYEGSRNNGVEYGLLWQRSGQWRRTRKLLSFALILALWFAPVWLPLGLVSLPRAWLQFVPTAIQPDWQMLNRNSNAFPIRFDAVCVVRHEGSVAVIRFEKKWLYHADYEASYWSNAKNIGPSHPPDSRSVGRVTNVGGLSLPIGPWDFSYGVGGEDMFWLTRPDETYTVEAFEVHGLPPHLRWLAQEHIPESDEIDTTGRITPHAPENGDAAENTVAE